MTLAGLIPPPQTIDHSSLPIIVAIVVVMIATLAFAVAAGDDE